MIPTDIPLDVAQVVVLRPVPVDRHGSVRVVGEVQGVDFIGHMGEQGAVMVVSV